MKNTIINAISEHFWVLITSQGFLIGFFSGLLKMMQDIRNGNFKWFIAITDITASSVVGYSIFEWSSESKSLADWQVIGLTIMLSLNAFFVVKIITNPNLIKKLLSSWFKINLKDEEKEV